MHHEQTASDVDRLAGPNRSTRRKKESHYSKSGTHDGDKAGVETPIRSTLKSGIARLESLGFEANLVATEPMQPTGGRRRRRVVVVGAQRPAKKLGHSRRDGPNERKLKT